MMGRMMMLRRALQLKCKERRHMWLPITGMILEDIKNKRKRRQHIKREIYQKEGLHLKVFIHWQKKAKPVTLCGGP
jgi:hypothetical protein